MAKVKGPAGTHQEAALPGEMGDPKEKQLPITGWDMPDMTLPVLYRFSFNS